MPQTIQSTKLHKLRVSPSLDFTAGAATPPKRDRGKSATRFKRHRMWVGLTWHKWTTMETDSELIDRIQADVGHLDFETMRDLFDAYESQIETYYSAGEMEKAAKLEGFLLNLVQKLNADFPGKDDTPMGLSDAINCHTNGQQAKLVENGQQNQGFQKRAKRGSKGITPAGKRAIRSYGVLLEESFGRRNLAFVTCTLPSLSESQIHQVCREWRSITRVFFQALTRMLVRKNLSPDYVQVTEIQEKRFEQWGMVCPHLHFVCQSRSHSRETWRISPDDIRYLWQRTLEHFLQLPLDCRYATRIESPRKSLAAELGKYLSKGGKILKRVIERGLGDYLPSSWYGVSNALRRLERTKRIERVGEVATWLMRHLDELLEADLIWFRRIYIKFKCPQTGIEREQLAGVVGRFKSKSALTHVLNMRPIPRNTVRNKFG